MCKFVKQIQIDCANTTAVRVDKPVFNADKDVFLIASYVVPEYGPLHESMDLKDGIVILEEKILQVIRDDSMHELVVNSQSSMICQITRLVLRKMLLEVTGLIDDQKTLW